MVERIKMKKTTTIIAWASFSLVLLMAAHDGWAEHRLRQQSEKSITHSAMLHEAGKQAREQIDIEVANGEITHPKNEAEAIAVLKKQLKSANEEIRRLKAQAATVSLTGEK